MWLVHAYWSHITIWNYYTLQQNRFHAVVPVFLPPVTSQSTHLLANATPESLLLSKLCRALIKLEWALIFSAKDGIDASAHNRSMASLCISLSSVVNAREAMEKIPCETSVSAFSLSAFMTFFRAFSREMGDEKVLSVEMGFNSVSVMYCTSRLWSFRWWCWSAVNLLSM